jgi:NADH:ubiquinone oxidoreductase subunit 4 (subunit M)
MLAGVLLKLGAYAILRVDVEMLPQGALNMVWLTAALGVTSILYGAVVCLAQDDLKRLVAYSSVSHMGFITLGIAAGVFAAQSAATASGAILGLSGAVFQMFAHGLVSAAMFMVAGGIGHNAGTRSISELGGIAAVTPKMSTFMMASFMASLGLPGLVGFVAELNIFIGTYAAFGLLVLVPVVAVVLTASYFIWAMQRAIFGPLNPRWKGLSDAHRHETVPLGILTALFAVFGIMPFLFLDMTMRWAARVLGVA